MGANEKKNGREGQIGRVFLLLPTPGFRAVRVESTRTQFAEATLATVTMLETGEVKAFRLEQIDFGGAK